MFNKRDMQYFGAATAFAKASIHRKAKIGAAIVKDREIIAAAHNVYKSHPIQMRYNAFRNFHPDNVKHSLHAEILSCLRVHRKDRLRGASIYISRVKHDKSHGNCRPCAGCMQFLKDHGIRDIYFTTENGYSYEKLN